MKYFPYNKTPYDPTEYNAFWRYDYVFDRKREPKPGYILIAEETSLGHTISIYVQMYFIKIPAVTRNIRKED